MIRLQDIAEMAGVSRTTVSNVINGNTKRVSQKTIDKIFLLVFTTSPYDIHIPSFPAFPSPASDS